jgi:hypothetical protein
MIAMSNSSFRSAIAAGKRALVRFGLALIVLAIAAGCAPQSSKVDQPSPGSAVDTRPKPVVSRDFSATQSGLVWIADGRLSERGAVLRETLALAEARGVCSTNLDVTEIDNRLAQGGAENWTAADALLSDGLVKYANEAGDRDVGNRDVGDRAALIAAASQAEDIRRWQNWCRRILTMSVLGMRWICIRRWRIPVAGKG